MCKRHHNSNKKSRKQSNPAFHINVLSPDDPKVKADELKDDLWFAANPGAIGLVRKPTENDFRAANRVGEQNICLTQVFKHSNGTRYISFLLADASDLFLYAPERHLLTAKEIAEKITHPLAANMTLFKGKEVPVFGTLITLGDVL